MTEQIPVIDLFSGPGGLAEGFEPCSIPRKKRRYKIVLSIEKEQHAFNTLVLRGFLRQFNDGLPTEYYEYLNRLTPEPNWPSLYPREWTLACEKTKLLELGDDETKSLLQREITKIKDNYGKRVVLIGGPPCQAYSIAGRARTAGTKNCTHVDDPRIYLYEQYVNIVTMLEPVIAVMENVKGMISSSIDGEGAFPKIMRRLRNACGPNSYELFALTSSKCDLSFNDLLMAPSEFIVRAEEFGIPQTRHRVFIICIRSDIVQRLSLEQTPRLEPQSDRNSLECVLGLMPKLRSGLSRSNISATWREVVERSYDKLERNIPNLGPEGEERFLAAIKFERELFLKQSLRRTTSGNTSLPDSCSEELKSWLFDDKLENLPNNHTRGHMPSDLERYLFASIYAKYFDVSPKTSDFPTNLASTHKSWFSKNFRDRFRVQLARQPAKTITSHIAKDGHYFIHPDPSQCRTLTVREAARIQTFPDNFLFKGTRTSQYVQVGNAVPPFLAHQISNSLWDVISYCDQNSHFRPTRKLIKHKTACIEVK